MKSEYNPLSEKERERRLKRCRKCYWWVEDKGFCRLNWLIQQKGLSYRRMCAFDPLMSNRFTQRRNNENNQTNP